MSPAEDRRARKEFFPEARWRAYIEVSLDSQETWVEYPGSALWGRSETCPGVLLPAFPPELPVTHWRPMVTYLDEKAPS